MRSLAVCVLLALTAASSCFGQAFTASLTGVVTDPAAAVIPGVEVKLRNTATNEERSTGTGVEGRYTFSQLLPGTYELQVAATGFKTFVQTNIILRANQSAAFDMTLQVGGVTERVEVAAAAVQLDTQTANQTLTLNRDMVLSLPTNARNPMSLVHATAGITAPGVGITQATQDQNHDRFGMNGGRSTTTGVLLDGVSVVSGSGWNGLLYSPSVDAVQEVQVIRNTYDAQYGRSGGGVISIVTKGGSTEFHGTAYEFLRNSALDANTWANNRNGQKKPIFQRSQFGGNFSGPIWESKRLFFFGNYEGLRQGTPATSIVNLPTAAERQGDFSDTFNSNGTLSVIYNPFTTRPNPSGSGSIRDPFPGNRIPASMIDPVGQKTVALYPEPTGPGDPYTHARNYAKAGKSTAVTDRGDFRIDWARSEKHMMYGRYSRAFRLDNLPPAGVWQSYGGTGPIHGNRRYHITVGNTFIPNPTWVINLLAGHGSWTEKQRSDTYGRDGTEIGLPASLVSQFDVPTIPQIYPSGYSNISHSRDLALKSRVDNVQLNVTKEMGIHSIRFGFGWESNKQTGGGLFSADFNFSRGMTAGPTAVTDSSTSGNAIASMLLGTGSGGQVQKPALGAINRVSYSFYLQDTWRVSRRLTLNPGVRYEIQKPATERYNRYSNFHYDIVNPLGGQVGMDLRGGLVFLDENNRYSWDPDYTDISPRMGLSYKITEKLVLRAGYGIFYPLVLGSGDMTGFSANTPWVTSRGGDGITPQDLFRNPYPNGLVTPMGSSLGALTNVGLGAGSYQRDHPSGYMQNYSADFQYELNRSSVIQIGYTGHQGRKLNLGYGLSDNQIDPALLSMGAALDRQVPNPFYRFITSGVLAGATVPQHRLLRPFPHFSNVSRNGQTPGGSSSYNALTAQLTQQFSGGLLALISYQWSKGIDNIAETEPSLGGAADGIRNNRDLSIERSISAHHIPHSLVASAVYDLPFGRGRQFGSAMPRVLDYLAGGWQISSIVRLQSGLPVRMTAPSTISAYGFGTQLPNVTSGPDVSLSERSPEHWFNTAAFSAPAPFTIGSAPRRINELRADWGRHADVAIMKNFVWRERVRTQFRAEMFNLTNTPQFGWPDTGFGSTTFGRVTSTMNVSSRNVQFGLKISF
jgi:hypothetical protein